MNLFPLLCLLTLSLVREGTSTHLETCECHEIRELVNASVQQAVARLEDSLGFMINTAISNISTTDETPFSDLESRLTSTLQGLLTPIQTQLNYHLPPPPPTTSAPPPPPLGETADDPATSCKDLHDTYDASSGYYWIGEVGSAVRVYCNMSLTCGDVTGGWMRVANIDMTNTSQNCPSGLNLISSPKRVCDITSNGCVSTEFDVHGVQYSHVCGRVIAYQNRVSIAFYYQPRGIDVDYVYGVSLTHGQNQREHIWTFAGASDETSFDSSFKCPCINTNINPPPTVPSFIGSDYFCDTALESRWNSISDLASVHVSDPLWDGEGCGSTNTCCNDPQREVNPPWFVKTLSSPTSDNIEMRMCRPGTDGSTPFEIVEFYVQ